MKSASHSRRLRNAHQNDEPQRDQPFFSKSGKTEQQPFFSAADHSHPVQAKLVIGQPGDKFEQEADAVANRVVNGESRSPAQRPGTGAIQRVGLATSQEEEKPGTAEGRMEQDKLVQEKPEIQTQAAPTGAGADKKEKPVQMQTAQAGADKKEKPVQMQTAQAGADKKEKPVQMQTAKAGTDKKEKPVQMQTTQAGPDKKEKPVQMQTAQAGPDKKEKPVQMQTAAKPEEEKKVRTKETSLAPRPSRQAETDAAAGSEGLSSRLRESQGKGQALPPKACAEMESAMGTDLSGVTIHTDAGAAQLNEQLGAQAFTRGQDVYFNSGKYHPESSDGKRLLAHELTHVVQQTGDEIRRSNVPGPPTQRVPAYREFQPVVGANGKLAYAKIQDMPGNFGAHLMRVLRYHGIDYQVDANTHQLLIPAQVCGDMKLLWSYTSKANDPKWLAAHAGSP